MFIVLKENLADHSLECTVLFAPASRGQLALVVFEWEDAKYLGMDPTGENKLNDWQEDVSLRDRHTFPSSTG